MCQETQELAQLSCCSVDYYKLQKILIMIQAIKVLELEKNLLMIMSEYDYMNLLT